VNEPRPVGGYRAPSTRALAAACAALLCVSLAGIPSGLGGAAPAVVEIVLLLLGGALALRAGWQASSTSATSKPPLRAAAALLLLIGAGQVAHTKKAFPFMPYTMYGRAREGEAAFYEYQALHRSGARTRFRPGTVFATLGNGRIVKGLAQRLDRIAELEARGEPAAQDRALLREVCGALAARYNRAHAEDPLIAIDVVHVALPPPFRAGAARRRVVLTLPLESRP
jgi:hypothetical protein